VKRRTLGFEGKAAAHAKTLWSRTEDAQLQGISYGHFVSFDQQVVGRPSFGIAVQHCVEGVLASDPRPHPAHGFERMLAVNRSSKIGGVQLIQSVSSVGTGFDLRQK